MVSVYSDDLSKSMHSNHLGQVVYGIFYGEGYVNFRLLGYEVTRISMATILENEYQVYLPKSKFDLGEYVVSANKWEQGKDEVPMKMSLISAQQIAFNNPQTTGDILANSGEVYVQKSQLGGGSPMIRGFATNRVLLVVDGVKMNNSIFRSGNIQNVIAIDPFAIAETEILFGPGSVTYGSDAIGGVMDFHTLSPNFAKTDEPMVKAFTSGRYSSANSETTGHVHLSIHRKKLGVLTSFSFGGFGDLKMGTNGPKSYQREYYQVAGSGVEGDTTRLNDDPNIQVGSSYSQVNFMQKIKYQLSKNVVLDYGFHFSKSSDIPRYDRLTQISSGQFKYGEWYYGPQVWSMHNIRLTFSRGRALYDGLVITAANQFFEESRIDRKYKSNTRRTRTENLTANTLTLDFNKQLKDSLMFFYGADFTTNHNVSKGTSNQGISTLPRYPNSAMTYSGVYANLKKQVNEQIILTGGVRFNAVSLSASFDSSMSNIVSPSAQQINFSPNGSFGVVYKLNDNSRFTTNLSSGFRAPNVDDLGKVFDSEHGTVITPNTNLKPEYAYSLDFSFHCIVANTFQFGLTVFGTYLDNALVRRKHTLNGVDSILYDGILSQVYAVQNAGHAYVYGGSVDLKYIVSKQFTASAVYNYQYGKEVGASSSDVVPLRHIAPMFGKFDVTYKTKGIQMSLYVVANGQVKNSDLAESEKSKDHLYAKDENGNLYSRSWATLNFKSAFKPSSNLSVNFGVENITNVRYRAYSSGIVAPGRNIFVSLSLSAN